MANTPYDDVFRTLVNDCRSLLIPYVNEMFGENFTGDEEIRFNPNEQFMVKQDGEEEKRVTDTWFTICGRQKKRYHLECQSGEDHTMLIRMFEYDTQIALDGSEVRDDVLEVRFPHSGVLYLRGKETQKNQLTVIVHTPGGKVSYKVPVMRMQTYTLEEIFEKKLYILLPFYIFFFEKSLSAYENDEKARHKLRQEFESIREHLEELCRKGTINEYTKCTLMDLSGKVIDHLTKNYDRVKKEVRSVMVGQVLEYEAKTILRRGQREGMERGMARGIAQGMAQGAARGKMQTLVHLIAKKWNKNQSVPEITDALEEEEGRVARIVDLLKEYGSDNTEEVVTKALEDQLLTK